MPILELSTAKQTSTKESDESVTELPGGFGWFPSGEAAPAALAGTLADSAGVEAFWRLFQAARRAPMLILREADREASVRKIVPCGAAECPIEKQAYGFHLGARCAR
jgi:hypothetical protein